jgi:perosamine synthetase
MQINEKINRTIEFIKYLYPSKKLIGLHEPVFIGNEKKYIEKCIDSTFVSSVGEFVTRFEKAIVSYTGIPYAVACVNGTAALHTALILCDVNGGDEVLTQALTFVATANAISYCQAHAIFIDSDSERLGMCPKDLEAFLIENAELNSNGFCYNIKTGRRIKACIPMHVFGHPVDTDAIKKICDRFHISLIEDSAESMGSFYKGKHTGAVGEVSVLSFNGNKTVTTGGGGMILTTDEKIAKKAKHLTTTAKIPHAYEFFHDMVGYNYRLPNLNAALGVAQMEQLPAILNNKIQTAQLYREFFKSLEIKFVDQPKDSTSNFWLNAIILDSKKERDLFLAETNAAGVMTRPTWALMPELEHFKLNQATNLRNAKHLRDCIVNLPSSYRAQQTPEGFNR